MRDASSNRRAGRQARRPKAAQRLRFGHVSRGLGAALGRQLFTVYLLPFELTSLLLLVAIVGAVALAKKPT